MTENLGANVRVPYSDVQQHPTLVPVSEASDAFEDVVANHHCTGQA
jgi:hypothetical protein